MTTIIINPELFGAPDCNAQTEAFAEWVKASPHDDDKPILLPGEWEVNTRRERQKQGFHWMREAGRPFVMQRGRLVCRKRRCRLSVSS